MSVMGRLPQSDYPSRVMPEGLSQSGSDAGFPSLLSPYVSAAAAPSIDSSREESMLSKKRCGGYAPSRCLVRRAR